MHRIRLRRLAGLQRWVEDALSSHFPQLGKLKERSALYETRSLGTHKDSPGLVPSSQSCQPTTLLGHAVLYRAHAKRHEEVICDMALNPSCPHRSSRMTVASGNAGHAVLVPA
jgi:hypothetical protein